MSDRFPMETSVWDGSPTYPAPRKPQGSSIFLKILTGFEGR